MVELGPSEQLKYRHFNVIYNVIYLNKLETQIQSKTSSSQSYTQNFCFYSSNIVSIV